MKEIKHKLGLWPIISISIGSMLGSGIFVLPGIAFSLTGPSTYLAYLLSALLVLPAALSKSELATAMPTSGGTYIYLERTFGPLTGTIAGIGLWLSVLLKSAFALIGFGAYLSVFTNINLNTASLLILVVLVCLNILGIGKVSKVLMFVVFTCIFGLLILSGKASFTHSFANFENFLPRGLSGLFAATGLVFVSFAGVTKVAAIADEIHEPEKNLPKGILISLLIVSALYSLINFFLAGQFSMAELSGNLRPIYDFAVKVGGPIVGYLFAALAILTMSSMANAGILAASRFPFAMSRDQLLPSFLGKLGQKFLTPIASIIASGVIVAVAILNLDVPSIAKLASAFMLIIYIAENIAVIVLRESRVQWYKPGFKSPFYPWVQIIGIIGLLYILISMKLVGLYAFLVISVPSILIFVIYARTRVTRKGVVGIRGARRDLAEDGPQSITLPQHYEQVDFSQKANIIVALFGRERSPETLVEVGAALVGRLEMEVAHLIEVPEQTVVRDLREEFTIVRSLRRRLKAMESNLDIKLQYDPVVSHDILKNVHEISSRLDCHWLLTEWGGRTSGAFTINNPIAWLKDHLSCSIAVFRDAGVRNFKKIMVVVQDIGTENVVLSVANHLANVFNAQCTLIRYISDKENEVHVEDERLKLFEASKKLEFPANIVILRGEEKIKSLIAVTAEYDLLLYSDFRPNTYLDKVFGSRFDKLTSKAACSVLSLQKYVPH
ncbi:MAG: APC family permease [Bacteriovoracaceae bacterium]